MPQDVKHLVVDSGAFIKNSPIHEYAENVYSVPGAVKEIKDKATLQRLQFLPYHLKLNDPTSENYKHVVEFSKKTGDYSSLSVTDLQIIALTYQLEKELVGTEHLNKDPSCKVSGNPANIYRPLAGFYCPESEEDDDDTTENDEGFSKKSSVPDETVQVEENVDQNLQTLTESNQNVSDSEPQNEVDGETTHKNTALNDEHDNEESWITPSNLADVQKKMGHFSLDSTLGVTVGCVTTDFAIQNVLLQMGLHVVSVDGMIIKHVKVFILRCFACFRTTNIMTKKFCPNCGNNTLKRVAVSINDDGSKNVHINFRKPINVRGTKYSLPTPRGGKHTQNPVLCEDQPFSQNKPAKAALAKFDVFSPEYEVMTSPFAFHDIHSRAASLGNRGMSQRVNQKNPNVFSKRTGNKKNKKR